MNNKFITIGVVAVIVLVGAGLVMANNRKDTTSDHAMHGDMTSAPRDNQSTTNTSEEVQMTNQVTYKGFAVVQKKIQVKVGTTVTWTNEDTAKHDVTPVNESADFKASELFGKGETYSWTFNKAGTYEYICSPHPYMKGVIEVVES